MSMKIPYALRYVWLIFLIIPLFAQGNPTKLESWKLDREASFEVVDDQQRLTLTRGTATYPGKPIKDGIVEFDMYTGGERSFFYVYFRQASQQDSEAVYIRTHKSNAPDTIQYTPIVQGRSAWQIYHGEKGTAPASLPINSWVPVKLKYLGNRLTMWVGDMEAPVMENVLLTGKNVVGGITLRGGIPRASKATYSAQIRNVRITELPSEDADEPVHSALPHQVMTAWVSNVFASDKGALTELPDSITSKKWQKVDAQYDGIFELLRLQTIPQDMRPWATGIRFVLEAPEAQLCALDLGYSDTLTLFHNGHPIVYSDASYRYSDNRQEGLLHAKQMKVFVPLEKGRNDITAIVADSFGGWGFQASLDGCDKVNINPDD